MHELAGRSAGLVVAARGGSPSGTHLAWKKSFFPFLLHLELQQEAHKVRPSRHPWDHLPKEQLLPTAEYLLPLLSSGRRSPQALRGAQRAPIRPGNREGQGTPGDRRQHCREQGRRAHSASSQDSAHSCWYRKVCERQNGRPAAAASPCPPSLKERPHVASQGPLQRVSAELDSGQW